MKRTLLALTGFTFLMFAMKSHAGGDPEFVKLPQDYKNAFTHYATINRSENEQVAKLYANDTLIEGYRSSGQANPGSVAVMEVYKVKTDEKGNALFGEDDIYVIDKLAAIAVMERREDWAVNFPEDHRLAGWGFGFYQPDGAAPKANNLDCVTCHAPLEEQNFLFSSSYIDEYISDSGNQP